jgi:hypothetical protein
MKITLKKIKHIVSVLIIYFKCATIFFRRTNNNLVIVSPAKIITTSLLLNLDGFDKEKKHLL